MERKEIVKSKWFRDEITFAYIQGRHDEYWNVSDKRPPECAEAYFDERYKEQTEEK